MSRQAGHQLCTLPHVDPHKRCTRRTLTAARWSVRLCSGVCAPACQMLSTLSLPPDASCVPEGDHLRPHTSCVCAVSRPCTCSLILRSRQASRVSAVSNAPCNSKRLCHGNAGRLKLLIRV